MTKCYPKLGAAPRPARRILILATCIGLTFLSTSQSPVSASSVVDGPEAKPAPSPEVGARQGDVIVLPTSASKSIETSLASASACTYYASGDYVHVSSTAFEASGHGWWENQGCAATQAVVTIQLQEYYSDGSWRNKGAKDTKTVYSGGGSGNRTTGRAACNDGLMTGWRSVIVVDLIGQDDVPGTLTVPARDIACRVY